MHLVEQPASASQTPHEVRAPAGARVLEIDWADGVTTRYRHVVLKGFCPCAACQGHQGPIAWVPGTENRDSNALELTSIDEVGSYALQLGWGDGHTTGIYSYRYLRELAELNELDLEEVKSRQFSR